LEIVSDVTALCFRRRLNLLLEGTAGVADGVGVGGGTTSEVVSSEKIQ